MKRTKTIRAILCLLLLGSMTAGALAIPASGGVDMGYELPYTSMTVGSAVSYDASNFYVNELRTKGADPGAVFYSRAEIDDSYAKLKAYYIQTQSLDAFLDKYGTQAEFEARYADTFYMAVTSYRNKVTAAQAKKIGIPNADYSTFQFYTSKNLSAWKSAGKVNGDAFVNESDTWSILDDRYSWAPELIRDPASGLFLIYFNTGSKNAAKANKLGTISGSESDTIWQIAVGYSETPDGPYRLLTGEVYYDYLCEHSDKKIKTVTDGGKTYAVYRSDVKSGNVKLTEVRNGAFVNLNGEDIGKLDPLLNLQYYHVDGYLGIGTGMGITTRNPGPGTFKNVSGTTVRGKFPVIDAHPFRDSNGTLFVYFVSGGQIWVVQMADVVTPIWNTLTKLAKPKYSSLFHTDATNAMGVLGRNMQESGEQEENNVNEGVFVTEYNGFFYLFYSRKGLSQSQNQTDYDVLVAVADNPFGPFVKVPQCEPVIGYTAGNDFIKGTGHCSMVRAGSEYWCVYCANVGKIGRSIGADRVVFQTYDGLTFDTVKSAEISANVSGGSEATQEQMTWSFANHNGQTYASKGASASALAIPFGNGPTYSVQPGPAVTNNCRNVLQDPDVTVTVVSGDASTAKYINDGMFSAVTRAQNYETRSEGSTLAIRFDFANPKKIKSILIYSPFDRLNAASKIAGIRFTLAEKPAWYPAGEAYSGVCGITDLAYESYAYGNGSVRRGVSANAVFREITVSSVTVTVDKKDLFYQSGEVRLSEIVLMGTDASGSIPDSAWLLTGATNAFGEMPDLANVSIDAVKGSGEGWTTVPVTASAQGGKIGATLQTQISEGGVYILLDVEDKFGVYYSFSEMNEVANGSGDVDKHTGVAFEIRAGNGPTWNYCADSHNFVSYDKRDHKWYNGAVRKSTVNGIDHFTMEIYITWDQLGVSERQDTVYLKVDYKYRQNRTMNTFSITGGEQDGVAIFNRLGLSVLPAERVYTFTDPVIPEHGYGIRAISMSYTCEVFGSATSASDQAYLADGDLQKILPYVSVSPLEELRPVMSVFNESEVRRYNGTESGYEYYDFIRLELCDVSDVGYLKWYIGGSKQNMVTAFDLYVSSDGLKWELVNFATKEWPLEYLADNDRNYCTAVKINRENVKYILIGIISGKPLTDKLQYALQEFTVMDRSYRIADDPAFSGKTEEETDPVTVQPPTGEITDPVTTGPETTGQPSGTGKGCKSSAGIMPLIALSTFAAAECVRHGNRKKNRQSRGKGEGQA